LRSGYCPNGFEKLAARVNEKAHSLALICACSRVKTKASLETLTITNKDAFWAFKFTLVNAINFYLWSEKKVTVTTAGNKGFLHELSTDILDWLILNTGKKVTKSQLARRFRGSMPKDRQIVLDNLIEQRLIATVVESGITKPITYYTYVGTDWYRFSDLLKELDNINR
jgi:hypothetical protein